MQNTLWIFSRPILFVGASLALMSCAQEQGENHEAHEHLHGSTEASSSEHLDHDGTAHEDEAAHESETNTLTTRSADSHTHGGAVLSVVAENNAVVMELETPLYNLLGFEYEPKTPEEKARVSEVEARLLNPETLIRFNPDAGCSYDKPVHGVSLFEAHSGDDHDAEHDEEHGEDHKDVILEYGLQCKSIEKLKKIDTPLFEVFPFFKELELVYLGPSQQMSADLSSSRPTADLTR